MAKKTMMDVKKIRKAFENINDNRSKLALSLLDKAEFMETILKELQRRVEEEGAITMMCQGDYFIERENPALKSYNTTVKNYAGIIKQLHDLLPTEIEDDGFEDFGD